MTFLYYKGKYFRLTMYRGALIDEISFELRMETISMNMIFAVMLCYLSSSERKD